MGQKNRHVLGLSLAALLLTAVGILALELRSSESSWSRVERRDLVVAVDVEGELRAVDSEQLGPPQIKNTWNFTIVWMAPEGSEVTAGQPVLRFDTSQLEQKLQQKVAESDEAQKSLEKAETDHKMERKGLEKRLAEAEARARKAELVLDVPEEISASADLQRARIDHRLALLEIESLQGTLGHVAVRGAADVAALVGKRDRATARVNELRDGIEAMNVKAQRAGTVTYIANRWNREKKKVGDSVWRAERLLEIPDLSRIEAEGEVAEAHMGRLEIGNRVSLHLDAHPDQAYGGTVCQIRRAVERKSRRNPKKVVKLEIELDRTDTERMRPGMRFRGEIEVERLVDALVVPEGAVFVEPEGAAVYVKRLAGELRVVPRFGPRNKEFFAVMDGLEEGDRVRLRDSRLGEGG